MKGNLTKTESNSLWKWKGINFQTGKPENKLSEFFKESGHKLEDSILGPGIGAGIGCGIGLGMGIAGGAGFDGSPRNHLKMVLGIGFGLSFYALKYRKLAEAVPLAVE
ncbi:Hypothetical predicted protein [Olea europaea subsp. europaea]|uniref:Uncharacterized protein n=1 Tax=Olea europaea subsp. europaea TaxID=158383 RepID=A0A8S0S7H2_OLEEU|nr:Hypothetical predicted protein [Olea europaea subsp. europaea]